MAHSRKLEQLRLSKNSKKAHAETINSTNIWWIEQLLQTPVDVYRKFVVWRILAPYLINIRKYSAALHL